MSDGGDYQHCRPKLILKNTVINSQVPNGQKKLSAKDLRLSFDVANELDLLLSDEPLAGMKTEKKKIWRGYFRYKSHGRPPWSLSNTIP